MLLTPMHQHECCKSSVATFLLTVLCVTVSVSKCKALCHKICHQSYDAVCDVCRSPCDAGEGEQLCDYCSQPAATRKFIQQWEQQLRRKAVAKVLREQKEAAGAAAGSDTEDEQPAGDAGTLAAGGAAAVGGWQARGTRAGACSNSISRPKPGAWAPAKAHCSGAGRGCVATGVGGDAASDSGSDCDQAQEQDENLQPEATAASAALGVASCVTEGVLLPGSMQQPAAGVAQVKGPAEKPQLKKRRLSRGQQPWGAFKAPRKQPVSSSTSSTAAAIDASCSGHADTSSEPEGADGQQQQPEEVAGVPKAGVQLPAEAGASAAAVGIVRLRTGLGRAGAGRQAFKPPIRH
jgi:hypothetical protein